MGPGELKRLKWGLMVAIVLGFFVLDAMFLRAAGVGERWKLLMLIYGASGLVTAVFWALDGQAGQNEAGVQCGPRGTGLFAVAAAVFDVGALALASEPRFGGAAEHEEGQPR